MAYSFRTTQRVDENTYVEDRGYPFAITRGDEHFDEIDSKFSEICPIGKTVQRGQEEGTWEVVDEFPLLETLKSQKLAKLSEAWDIANNTGVVDTELGFSINATVRSYTDIEGCIKNLEATGQQTKMFCAADNTFHEVTLDDLKVMEQKVIEYGQLVYAEKWRIRTMIFEAKTVSELEQIEVKLNV